MSTLAAAITHLPSATPQVRNLARAAFGLKSAGKGPKVGPLSITSDGFVLALVNGRSSLLGRAVGLEAVIAAVLERLDCEADILAAQARFRQHVRDWRSK